MHTRTRNALALGLILVFTACGQDSSGPGQADYASESDALSVCAPHGVLQGVDVSVYQGNINWAAVAAAGIQWGYAKATEGTGYSDPTFPGNWSGMKAHGIARGAYHFFHPGVNGTAQADHFLAYAGAMGAGDLPPMLDWEVTDGVGGATAAANAQAFINEIRAKTGRSTVIYTSPGLWSSFGAGNFGSNPLWVADWLYCSSGSGGCCPLMPGGWSNWVFWQWTDAGSVSGISGRVDRDVFNGTAADLAALAGSSSGGGGGGSGGSCSNPNPIGHGIGLGGPISSCSNPGGAPGLPPRPSGCGSLGDGDGLGPGDTVSSCDGRFQLVMQTDGNVVLYEHGNPLWSTGTGGKGGYLFVMQGDGNLVLYSNRSCPLWASNTGGHPGAYLALQSDGNLVVYAPGGTALWSSGTGPIPPVSSCGIIHAGQGMGPGDSVAACGGCFNFVMQGDGNLVLYQNGGHAIWATGTNSSHGYEFVMQGDGNAVEYSNQGCPLWSSNTSSAGAFFAVQDDGNLVVYTSSGRAIWASNTVACPGGCSCYPPLSISPSSASVPPKGSASFSASGGSGGYHWSLNANASGASLSGSGYTAGATPNVTDIVEVADSTGHTATANVSVGPGISIAPSPASSPPRGSIAFSAMGGSGTGYKWSLSLAASGGSITSAGAYTAGATANTTDTVKVVDSLGNVATLNVKIGPGVSVSPSSGMTPPRGVLTFTASGGSGTGFTWTIPTNESGGSITSDGVYTAGSTGSVTDTVEVTDSLGNSAAVNVTVGPGVTVTPVTGSVPPHGSLSFMAKGGSGTGYTWSVPMSASGATITSAGLYTAGPTGNATDTVQVTDSLGNIATAQVSVGPGISITPPMPASAPLGTILFTATGGSGTGYVWSLPMSLSGGAITSAGAYTAGKFGDVSDTVHVVDSLGNTASVQVAVGAGLSLAPAAPMVAPRGTVSFTASGGGGMGYTWSLSADPSGGSITSAGAYTAGSTPNTIDVVDVVDSLGNHTSTPVSVGPGVSIAPMMGELPPHGSIAFSATGGSGTGYSWSVSTNSSGGTVTSDGVFTAGSTGEVVDTVQVTDSLGNSATAQVDIGPAITVTPAMGVSPPMESIAFSAKGGSGAGYTWSLIMDASGGSMTPEGVYTAGTTPNTMDLVAVTDSLGNVGTAPVNVGAGLMITPRPVSVPPRGSFSFSAIGGSGEGYVWSLAPAPFGGSITQAGVYTAGPTANVIDTVQVKDSLGNVATAQVPIGAGVTVTPAQATIAPMQTVSFAASGGTGTGFVWSLLEAPSGGSISSSGTYTAGPAGAVTDTVQVSDSLGNSALAQVSVSPGLTILPAMPSVAPMESLTFSAIGGSGTGYVWLLGPDASGATITADGVYTAGKVGGVTDHLQVIDSAGNRASVDIQVGAGLTLSPTNNHVAPRQTIHFMAMGGSGSRYDWSMITAPSGATITSDGSYTAGSAGDVTDAVQVVDPLGNMASTKIVVGPGVTISPAMPTASPGGTIAFKASGGSGTGYVWSLPSAPSKGSITSDGAYTAGPINGVSDTVEVADSLGNTATVAIQIASTDGGTGTNWVRSPGCGCADGGSGGVLALLGLLLGRGLFRRRRLG